MTMMTMKRRTLLQGALLAPLGAAAAAAAGGRKVLRTAMNSAEVGFDPPQVSDQTSVQVNAHIFEAPLAYDYLARPAKLVPLTAAALPEVSDNFTRFVVTLRPGIFFAEHPAFGGRPRELVAADYVYSIKRYYDPRIKTEHLYVYETARLLGLSELRAAAIKDKQPFDYDRPVAGLRALDRYRFEIRLAAPDPRFVHVLASGNYAAALAREVVEQAPDGDVMAHPVGTGPFRLKSWRRGSLVVLERNPGFREQYFEAEPAPGDAQGQAIARHLQGRRLPLLDEVHLSIITESQPRWLAFVGGELDLLELPTEMAPHALPRGQLAPALARRGVHAYASYGGDIRFSYFNLDDAQIGGITPERVALRRAITLAYDNEAELRLIYKGQGVLAQSMLPPAVYGYDPELRSEAGRSDAARAQALLDLYGYDRRDAEGYRTHPDGSRLALRKAGTTDARQRQLNELWKKRMDAVGLRMEFEQATFGELIKKSLAGQLQIWGYTWSIGSPDGDFFLGMAYGPNAGQSNDAHFRLPAFDRLYERQHVMPDGPERLALMREANRLMLAYMPYQVHAHTLRVDMCQPGVQGFMRHPLTRDWWRYVDVPEQRA
ncbi:ABC transporter substrate-binding protein [Paucibacter soli]|uniref:ABC transporter substrate-binding protein n=1 Tax=Paucibacter soli TaxID=3133433 RepID=UPI0030A179C5